MLPESALFTCFLHPVGAIASRDLFLLYDEEKWQRLPGFQVCFKFLSYTCAGDSRGTEAAGISDGICGVYTHVPAGTLETDIRSDPVQISEKRYVRGCAQFA